jgi:hypothetical protein
MHRRLLTTLIACGASIAVASQVSASVLAPSGNIAAAATAADPTTGSLIISTGPTLFSAPTFSGTLTESVWQESPSANPLGGLTFTYRLSTNTGAGFTSIERVTGFNFSGFSTDATYLLTTGSDQAPSGFTRNGSGSVVGFDFDPPAVSFDPGESTAMVVIRTNAVGYTAGSINIIDGSSTSVPGFAPIPEPAAIGLLALGAGALLLRRRRRCRGLK